MGESHFAAQPLALYGAVLLLAACAYYTLTRALLALHGEKSTLAAALGSDAKGKASIGIYAVAIAGSFFFPWFAGALYLAVAIMWLVPDRRIERALAERWE